MKKTVTMLVISLVLLFVIPLLNVWFGGMNGMAICFLLFFMVNPIFFVLEGIFCSSTVKQHWWLPLASALIYLLSCWVLLDIGETAFLIYAGVYLAISAVCMLAGYGITKIKPENPLDR